MRSMLLLIIVFVLETGLLSLGAVQPVMTNLFFAMDTATRDSKHNTIQAQAEMLQELGYAGYGGSGYDGISNVINVLDSRKLRLFNVYLTVSFEATNQVVDRKMVRLMDDLSGHESVIWLAVSGASRNGEKFRTSSDGGDAVVVPMLQQIADMAQARQVRVALYPHTGFWLERVEDAIRVADKVNKPSLGSTFNLCHWLKVEGERDPLPVLKQAVPRLFFVTINGADSGDTKKMSWNRLIQPLDTGSYDVTRFLGMVRESGYTGPIGFQGYGIGGDVHENLKRTMSAWRKMTGQ